MHIGGGLNSIVKDVYIKARLKSDASINNGYSRCHLYMLAWHSWSLINIKSNTKETTFCFLELRHLKVNPLSLENQLCYLETVW